jgi:UDPglucose 6-dehydrogenase/GDP-mannose 6-dehydrogenase
LGHEVRAVDVLADRVAGISAGQAPFHEPGLAEMLGTALSAGRLRATTELAEAVAASEVTFITVGTPQAEEGIDLSQVGEAARQIGVGLRSAPGYSVVAVKSTVVPGTTDTLVRGVLEQCSGKRAGEFGLCMNPEFLREGSAIEDFLNPDRIVVGQWDEKSGQVLAELYGAFACPKIFTALRNAEMMKYASNALLATLISYSNEIATVCEATPGTDAETVLRGVHLDRRLSPVINGQRVSPGILSFLLPRCSDGGERAAAGTIREDGGGSIGFAAGSNAGGTGIGVQAGHRRRARVCGAGDHQASGSPGGERTHIRSHREGG